MVNIVVAGLGRGAARDYKPAENSIATVDGLYLSVRRVIEEDRKVLSVAANTVLGRQNWFIGKLIVEDEQIAREWYMNECVAGGWSSRDLDRQVSTKYSTVMPSDEILRREIEAQKELYRMQMQSEDERLPPAKSIKKGVCK